MKDFIARITKLVDVKSLMTLMFTIVFSILVLRGSVTADQFITIFGMIVAFYFGVQHEKNS